MPYLSINLNYFNLIFSGSRTGGEKRGMVSIGDVEEVMVTHVVDPEHFHCQLSKTAPQLDALMESLDKHYSTLGEEEELLMAVSLGKHCVAKYSADQDWYRAQITGIVFIKQVSGTLFNKTTFMFVLVSINYLQF